MSSICEWENGSHAPRLGDLPKLAKVLRVSLADLIEMEER